MESGDVHLLPFHLGNSLHFVNDVSTLVRWEDVWHVSCVQQHVDVLNEGFILDLAVAKRKVVSSPRSLLSASGASDCRASLTCCSSWSVRSGTARSIDEGGEFGGALSPDPPIADQQQVAVVLFQHTADSGDVLDGELKHDEVHGRFADVIKLLEVEIHHLC